MAKKTIVLFCLVLVWFTNSYALERPDREFKIFQFPPNMIPCIDGKFDDWDIIPDSLAIGTNELSETVRGKGTNYGPDNPDVKVKVGWVKGMNKLYFLYEATDNYWNMYYGRGDLFEVSVDGDLSGGQFTTNELFKKNWSENRFRFKGFHAQNYHIKTPPGEGCDWCLIWTVQPWMIELPYSNHAYSYNFKEGESGKLMLEFFITPFDYAPIEEDRAIESKLVENTIIGLSWAVCDHDQDSKKYEGFWNLSHKTEMDRNGSDLVAFRLMPLEDRFLPPIMAQWSFKVVDMDRRLVAFKDLSHGTVTSWLWDFGDGTTSTEQNPIHQYMKADEYITVVLNIEGPAGKARRSKVWAVALK